MFEQIDWAFPLAVTLHNVEEAIWLPSWAATHRGVLPWQISPPRFRIGVAVVTVLAWIITWLSLVWGPHSVWTYLFVAYTFIMFLNVFIPHVPATILLRGYAPGVVTAVVIILPITTVLLSRTWTDRTLPSLTISIFVFGIPLVASATVAALFTARFRRAKAAQS